MPAKDKSVTSSPSWMWPNAAYIHVPFCAHHCGYCDFAIATEQDHLIELYLDALAAELATLGEPQPVRTLFLGGGTPTHLSAAQLERLLSAILRWLPLDARGETEFSIECNPDTLTADKIAVLADHGVNRVSLGAQSFHADLLHVLERAHDPEEIRRAVERAAPAASTMSRSISSSPFPDRPRNSGAPISTAPWLWHPIISRPTV